MLFQETLRCDDELHGKARKKWVEDIARIRAISIEQEVLTCYLHGFGQASKKGSCALVHLVYRTYGSGNDDVYAKLLRSRSRVAPLETLTIQLMYERILAHLMTTVMTALGGQVKDSGTKYWLDSKTAFRWIKNKGEWNKFVRHRSSQGKRGVAGFETRSRRSMVEGTALADLRGRSPVEPITSSPVSEKEAMKTGTVMEVNVQEIPFVAVLINISRYISLSKLVRVTACVVLGKLLRVTPCMLRLRMTLRAGPEKGIDRLTREIPVRYLSQLEAKVKFLIDFMFACDTY